MSSGPYAGSRAMREMLVDEYQRVLSVLPPCRPGSRHSEQQIAWARNLARRNVLDRLDASSPKRA